MTFGLLFWIIMLFTLLFGGWSWHRSEPYGPWGSSFLLFVLLFLLGWKVFGAPIH